MKVSLLSTISFLSLLLSATSAPAPAPLDTTTHSPNPSNALLARNNTAAAYRAIIFYCFVGNLANGVNEEMMFCGHPDQRGPQYYLTPKKCKKLCRCDCDLRIRCYGWRHCPPATIISECIHSVEFSGPVCGCVELGQGQIPNNLPPAEHASLADADLEGANVTGHAFGVDEDDGPTHCL